MMKCNKNLWGSFMEVRCYVCAKVNGSKPHHYSSVWICWDCKEILIAQKALCGSQLESTTYGLEFSDGTVFCGFFIKRRLDELDRIN